METFAKWPKWGQYLATLILGGLICFAIWYVWISNLSQDNEALKVQDDQLAAEIKQGQEAQKRLDELNRQMEIILKDLEVFKSIIPPDPQTGTLLRAFQSFARDQSLEIVRISPSGMSKQELYSQQPYAINVTGGYHDIALFFDKLAHMRRIVNVSGLEMDGVPKKGGFQVNARFNAMVYMQNPEPQEEAAGAPAAAKEKTP